MSIGRSGSRRNRFRKQDTLYFVVSASSVSREIVEGRQQLTSKAVRLDTICSYCSLMLAKT